MTAPSPDILLSRKTIAERIRELGLRITADFKESDSLCLVPVMDGGMIFAADLMREIPLSLRVIPIKASSYGDATTSSGTVKLPGGIPGDVRGCSILIIDDILDTGKTLETLRKILMDAGAESVRTCVLLRKESAGDLHADYIGFKIPDMFVIGYGLDLAGAHRNLPDIRVLKED
jgi:hypoxanthine phosphoribosyltransferase